MVLDLQKIFEDSKESPHTPHLFFPYINILHQCGTFVTIKKPILRHYYYLKSIFIYLGFLNFYSMSFFSSRTPYRISYYIYQSCLPPQAPFVCDNLSILFTKDLDSREVYQSGTFVDSTSIGIVYYFSHIYTGVIDCGKGTIRYNYHHIISRVQTFNMIQDY